MYSYFIGPFECRTLGGSKYFVTLLDEYITYLLVQFVDRKSMLEDSMAEIIKVLENAFNKKPRSICLIQQKNVIWFHTYEGREYMGKALQAWLTNRGIVQEPTTAYYPDLVEKRKD